MKYTVISAYIGEKFWDADTRKNINAALALVEGNYIELAPNIWVFRSVQGYSGHTTLAEVLRQKARTFVQFSSDSLPYTSLPLSELHSFHQFLNS